MTTNDKQLPRLDSVKAWLGLQALALGWGNYVGWSTIVDEVEVFCAEQGKGVEALLSFSGTATTNPLLTPCFWGSVVFAITLVWTLRLLIAGAEQRKAELDKLLILLVGGTAFALINNIMPFYRYYTEPAATAVGCSAGGIVSNPFATSCFLGLAAFALAALAGLQVRRNLRS